MQSEVAYKDFKRHLCKMNALLNQTDVTQPSTKWPPTSKTNPETVLLHRANVTVVQIVLPAVWP